MKLEFRSALRRWSRPILLLGSLSSAAYAQTSGEEVPRGRTVATSEQVKSEIERSRFRLGPIRLLPHFGVSGGYEGNVYGTAGNEVSDWTATATVGTRWAIPFGTKVYLRGDVLPEYTWYSELAERRRFGGLYQASLLGFFNRLSAEAGGSYARTYDLLSSQDPFRVFEETERGFANLELQLSRPFSVFAGGEVQKFRNFQEEVPPEVGNVGELDRTSSFARAGLRYRISRSLDVSARVEYARTEFDRTRERDNQSDAGVLALFFNRPRLFLNLSGGYRSVEPRGHTNFPEYSTGTGSYFISFFVARPLELQAYGRRGLGYGLNRLDPYYIETANGGGINLRILQRLTLRGYGEYIKTTVPVGGAGRRDSITTFGGGLAVRLFANAVFSGLVSQSDYRSNTSTDRPNIVRYSTSLSFGGELAR